MVAAAVVLAGNSLRTLKEWMSPVKRMSRQLEAHEMKLEQTGQRLDRVDADMQVTMRCLLRMMNHEITGNDMEQLREQRDALQDYLSKRRHEG